MRGYLPDSGIASEVIDKKGLASKRAGEHLRAGDVLGICIPVLGELVASIEGSDNPSGRLPKLRTGLSKLKIWPYDRTAAFEFGRLFAELRRRGRQMQQIDIQIAAIALTLGNCTVVSTDGDLRAVPGLDVEDWSQAGRQ